MFIIFISFFPTLDFFLFFLSAWIDCNQMEMQFYSFNRTRYLQQLRSISLSILFNFIAATWLYGIIRDRDNLEEENLKWRRQILQAKVRVEKYFFSSHDGGGCES